MEHTPIISIIMPVYRVEKYVGRAIESILTQTLGDFEFLIVDDGSPDSCGLICDEYAAKDSRIRVIHQDNSGAANARNAAMKYATGKYYYFMDADDWAQANMLEDMVALADAHNAQCVVAGYYIDTYYSESEHLVLNVSHPDTVYQDRQDFRRHAYRLFDKNLLYTPWNKLYREDYLRSNGLKFPHTFWDDFPFNLSVLRDVERVVVTSKQYYHFIRARAESETAKYVAGMYEKREEEHLWLLDLYQHWDIRDDDSLEFLARRYIERLLGCIENITSRECTLSRKERRRQIRQMISGPFVDESLLRAKPRSTMMKLMLIPIRWHWIGLIYLESRVISWVKARNTRLFATLKAKR
jgi:glycosyltransferase involved in cell wall biosynthesis